MKTIVLLTFLLLAMFLSPAPAQQPSEASGKTTKEEITTQFTKKVFPKVAFKEASPTECIAWLKKQGLPLETTPDFGRETENVKITLTLNNVPALEVLKYLTNLSNTRFEVMDSHVLVRVHAKEEK
jgi:hypothetical protein